QDRVIGLATGVAVALLSLRLRHRLDVSAEILPSHHLPHCLQRIALGADRLQPALNIEKALLPHDPLAPSAHYRVRSPSQIRRDLARGIFRGAKNILQPHRRQHWVIPPKANSAFVAAMEDVLAVYTRPRDGDCPLVCLDETSKQLIAETRVPIPMKAGRPARFDYEYERNGTANL